MILRQLFDKQSSTYTYLIADDVGGDAALIDPVVGQVDRDLALIDDLGLRLKYTLDTHVHADHVTGAGQLRKLRGSQSVVSLAGDVPCVDIGVSDGDTLSLGALLITVLGTPGHTAGCVSFLLRSGDNVMIFCGDALLIRGCGRTDFQQGSAERLYASVHDKIFSLPDSTLVYPGHDYRGFTLSTVGEEKAHNPRLKIGISMHEFVELMENLSLPDPKMMDIALPANMDCGLPDEGKGQGFLQCTPQEIGNLGAQVVVDVREAEEFDGALGHLDGAKLCPVSKLQVCAQHWDRASHYLLVCRSGRRSALACKLLADMGFLNLRNLDGGMVAWNAQRSSS